MGKVDTWVHVKILVRFFSIAKKVSKLEIRGMLNGLTSSHPLQEFGFFYWVCHLTKIGYPPPYYMAAFLKITCPKITWLKKECYRPT